MIHVASSMVGGGRRSGLAVLVTLSLWVAACGNGPSQSAGSPAASSGASATSVATVGPPAAGPWTRAVVDQPDEVTAAPSSIPKSCSPCHPQATLAFAAVTAPFGLVAVGVQQPLPHARAWRSTDGAHWTLVDAFPAPEGSVGLAGTTDGTRAVIVGDDPSGARSWVSTDGTTWQTAGGTPAMAGPAAATRMASVAWFKGQFVAVGNRDDPLNGTQTGAVWTSPDGLAWTREPDDPGFAGVHILDVAASESRLVAVGTTDEEARGTAAAWSTTDGLHWRRSTSPDLEIGIMRGVAATGSGFVAVGLGTDDAHATSWTSPDGLDWTAGTGATADTNVGLPIRMFSVESNAAGITAVGWKSDAGNGSAVVWRSTDGSSWQREPFEPYFSGGEMVDVIAAGPGLIAVGTTGYPDNDQATIWTRPQ
jgi:hypothetical protein